MLGECPLLLLEIMFTPLPEKEKESRPRPLRSLVGPRIWSTGSSGDVSVRSTLNVPP